MSVTHTSDFLHQGIVNIRQRRWRKAGVPRRCVWHPALGAACVVEVSCVLSILSNGFLTVRPIDFLAGLLLTTMSSTKSYLNVTPDTHRCDGRALRPSV